MRFNYIKLKEAGDERYISFSEHNNLVYSAENSKGKTTLLRLLLYGIGYSIPSTKNLQFEKCRVELQLVQEGNEIVTLVRECSSYIDFEKNGEKITYILPSQELELHSILFGSHNNEVLRNMLGIFYYDQERGWGLLNKGIVIGNNSYNFEELIRGLNNVNCADLISQSKKLSADLAKYKQMFSVSKYKEAIDEETKNLAAESYDRETESRISQCKIRMSMLKRELARIDGVLKGNKDIKRFISEIGILIRLPDKSIMKLSTEDIVELNDSIELLKSKKRIVTAEYNQVSNELATITRELQNENQQLSFFDDVESVTEIFDKKIASIPLDSILIEKKISSVSQEISAIKKRIRDITRGESEEIIDAIFVRSKKYLNALGLDGNKITNKYLFSNNTKGLSGAILHKTVFALRIACLYEVQEHMGIKLPIILDSPRGKEIDTNNINLMLNILKRDFSENQIIIASIHTYNLECLNEIIIQNRLIE